MHGRTRELTILGRDMDLLLRRAGKFTLREYADECGVSYKYLLQLRTSASRRPGKLYVDLLKPFTRLRIVDLAEAHRLSLRHRGRPLSLSECGALFSQAPEQELLESIKEAVDVRYPASLKDAKAGGGQTASGGKGSVMPDGQQRVYRRVFVGRQRELDKLRAAFDAAATGEGSLVMISGEPGIGKTAICGQLAAYGKSLGGVSLTGRCYEGGSLSLPYLAFIEALRSHILTCDTGDLAREIGRGAQELARIIPDIRDRLGATVNPPGEPTEDRYRLLQAVADFLGNMAARRPLLFVLEDLHGADQGTLEMLQHVARNLGGKRVLLVGTYRDVEVDRAHPLSASLAELRRLPEFGQIVLRGLAGDEVTRMLSGIFGRDTPAALGTMVHKVTEGNPVFIEEVARYLVEESFITVDGTLKHLTPDSTFEMSIPVGLRDVVGKRISRLGERCNRLLSIAAVIGREFRLDILERVAGMPEGDIDQAVQEATKAAVLAEYSDIGVVSYRFTHTFFRQTLYEEMIAPQRMRLHQSIARALESLYGSHAEDHASELAEHFSQSSNRGHMQKAVSYYELAARRATDVFAYAEAVRWLDRALQVQRALDPDDSPRVCDLLLDLCDSRIRASSTRRVLDVEAQAAFAIAEGLDDSPRAVRACMAALYAVGDELAGPGFSTPQFAEWAKRADRYSAPGSRQRAYADWALGCMKFESGDKKSGHKFLLQSFRLARNLGDEYGAHRAGGMLLAYRTAPQYTEDRKELAEALLPTASRDLEAHGDRTAFWICDTFLATGQRERTEQLVERIREMANRIGGLQVEMPAVAMEAVLAVMDGRLQQSLDMIEGMRVRAEESGLAQIALMYASSAFGRASLYMGAPLDQLDPKVFPMNSFRALACGHAGRTEEALSALEAALARRGPIGTDDDETRPLFDILLMEAAVLAGHRKCAELLLKRFYGTKLITTGFFYPTCIARHLGGAAALLGRYEEARQHYREAIRVCTEMRFRPELALTRLQLAELLLDHYPDEKYDALEHLDFAINEFRDMKMRPSLDRGLRRKDILKA